jgi:hypothetical protein
LDKTDNRPVPQPLSPTLSPSGQTPSIGAASPDPDLIALPAPPKGERTATVILMLITAGLALWMVAALLAEVRYALTPGTPSDVGDLATIRPTADMANRYTRATGLLGTAGAIRYGRAAEGDSFRLAPIAGNPKIWVEIRVPEGFEGPRFVPPTAFAGRLVPFEEAGIRHAFLRKAVSDQTDAEVPADAWLLIEGSSPRASRWAVALAALFVGFAGWNLVGVVRLLRRIRDRSGERRGDLEGEGAGQDGGKVAG